MQRMAVANRVVVVVLDGLKASAIDEFGLEALADLGRRGAMTVNAQTVRPSVTAAAMTTLFTGVNPDVHGIAGDSFGVPPRLGLLRPLPRTLTRYSIPTSVYIKQIPLPYRWLIGRLASAAGVETARVGGDDAETILSMASPELLAHRRGLLIMHWPDADEAGHFHGWGSGAYEMGARRLDAALGRLIEVLDIHGSDDTLLIVCSDHGGGGTVATRHDSDHPEDTTIPILLAGSCVSPTRLPSGVRLADVPATIAWALGADVPAEYGGRVLAEAFVARKHAA